VFTYKPWKWRYGYPVGYGIGANCQSGGPFGTTERCGLAPLHYRAETPNVFAGPKPELAGASWYRLTPEPAPLTEPPAPPPPAVKPGETPPVPAPALRPRPTPGGSTFGYGSALIR
jgi:hypothetical protein